MFSRKLYIQLVHLSFPLLSRLSSPPRPPTSPHPDTETPAGCLPTKEDSRGPGSFLAARGLPRDSLALFFFFYGRHPDVFSLGTINNKSFRQTQPVYYD